MESQNKPVSKSPLSDPGPRISKTPEKPIQLPRRAKNRGYALSLKEIRNVAQGLHKNQRGSYHPKDLQKIEDPLMDVGSISGSVSAKAKIRAMLPEKYEMLVEFFNCLLSSIRLLRMKGQRCTFTNISPQIETLTDRRFSYGHLAQLKYILPEAIGIEKILIRDERTLCVKPDLQLALQLDAFNDDGKQKAESGYAILKKMFHARLLDFFKTHAESDVIPQETLPDPFNQTKLHVFPTIADTQQETLFKSFSPTGPIIISNSVRICGSQLPAPSSSSENSLQRPSHMSQSFQRRFSQKTIPKSEETKLHALTSPLKPIASAETDVFSAQSPIKCSSKSPLCKRSFTFSPSKFKLTPSSPLASRNEESKPAKNEDHIPKELDSIEGTPLSAVQSPIKYPSKSPISERSFTFSPSKFSLPASSPLESCEEESKPPKIEEYTPKEFDSTIDTPSRLVFTPSRLMTINREPRTPKRRRSIPDEDSTSLNKSTTRPTRIRSLNFHTPVKNEKLRAEQNESEMSSADAAIIKFLPETLLQSIREKERKAMEDHDAGLIEAKRRQQMIACLPKLFDMIHLIFQSMNRTIMTKQELMYKIIVNHRDIVDKEEVEEQLKLLQELVPDWISGKLSSSGDFLFCINKSRSPESIHARLAEAA